MTDRELLELAALAAEIDIHFDKDGDSYRVKASGNRAYWNPLTDDGDALRLAVKLRLTVSWDRFDDCEYATATPPHTHQGYDCTVDQDPYAANRRATVRAAAEIGGAIQAPEVRP